MNIIEIKKRDGRTVKFDKNKITNAIFKAAKAVNGTDYKMSEELAGKVAESVAKQAKPGAIPTVEEVQDNVEKVLIEEGHTKTAKAYILYRKKRSEIRKSKALLGVTDELKLSMNAIKVLSSRYLRKDENRKVVETTEQLVRRVAKAMAEIERNYGKDDAYIKSLEEDFYNMITNLEFLPNSPTLMNAGTELGQLSACFVLPVGDDMRSIFESVKNTALVHQTGGGTGFSFSKLRPKGDTVKSTGGVASGPISFMQVFNAATEVIKQGGKRRGANMGVLRIDHPDILEFITCKEREGMLANFNISIAITEKFMKAVESNGEYDLTNPRTGETLKKIPARAAFNLLIIMSWKNGEPGIIFIDEMNKYNPTPNIGGIESTNPCIVGNSLISTTDGLMRMEDIAKNYPDGDLNIITDNRVPVVVNDGNRQLLLKQELGVKINTISKAWQTGIKDTLKLVTESGYEIIATPDHKIMTSDGWIEMKDLTPKHSVLIQAGAGKFNDNPSLPFEVKNEFISKNGRKSKHNFPKTWSKELGQVLGWLTGDGWLRSSDKNCRVGFTFAENDKEIMNYLKPIINNMYGKGIEVVKRENDIYHLSYHGKYFVDFFERLGIKPVKASGKIVPENIFTATEPAVIGFLQGLFTADGTIGLNEKNNTTYIRLTSKSERMIKDVQLLLINMGIKSRIYNRSRKTRENMFLYVTKSGESKSYTVDGICFELHISKDNILKFLEKIGFMCNKHEKKIEGLMKHGFYSDVFKDKVSEIKPNGKEMVYDLTEPVTHSLCCNSIVVSNCGEQPLLPYESCNLGSINLTKIVEDKKINWDKLKNTVRTCIRFLDNVVDANKYPIDEIREMTRANRKIGLGVMGFADMLIQLGIPYTSEDAIKTAENVMKFIQEESKKMSEELGINKGSFPNFKGSVYDGKYKAMRNATTTTIAPTGTLSVIADCSSGIEPIFAVSYIRDVSESLGHALIEVNPYFERMAIERDIYSEDMMKNIAKRGSIQNIPDIPDDIKKIFVTALDIPPEWHVRMQAAFQKYTDNAVSKTINFPNHATPHDVEKAFMLAWKTKCKGLTVYRYGSRDVQVLNIDNGGVPADAQNPCPTCSI